MKWFRFYSDACRNPKVAGLSDKDFRLWVSLLGVASENDGSIPKLETLRSILRVRLDHLSSGVDRLISIGLIDRLGAAYTPHSWAKFQYKSDTSNGRVTLHRSKVVTAPDTDTEQNTEKKEELEAPAKPSPRQNLEAVLDAERAGAVIEHRKRLRKPLTERAAKLLANSLGQFQDPNSAADRMIEKGWLSIDASWSQEPRGSPAKKRTIADEFSDLRDKMVNANGIRPLQSDTGLQQAISYLPFTDSER